MMPFEPFIVTAELPPAIHAWADRLRRAHFPPERNHLQAHVTLFHALAPSLLAELKPFLAQLAGEFSAPQARITGVMDLGKGTALAIDSPGMVAIRALIADRFHGALTAQDSHTLRLHITVQNKVTRDEAKQLQGALAMAGVGRDFRFSGLGLHIYRGGPWEGVKRSSFHGKQGG